MTQATTTTEISLHSLQDSQKLANLLSSHIKKSDIICLEGTLGAGKTTFSQMLINSYMGNEMGVTSPTFTLLQQYEQSGKTPIWHCDFYRLKDESELYELGLDDGLDHAITIIEWPEIAYNYLPQERLQLKFSLINDSTENHFIRNVSFNTDIPLGRALQKELNQW